MTKSWSFRVCEILEHSGNFHVPSAASEEKRTIPKVIFPGPGIKQLTEIGFHSGANDVERDVCCLCTQYKD